MWCAEGCILAIPLAVLSLSPSSATGFKWAFRPCNLLPAQQAVDCLHGARPAQPDGCTAGDLGH